MQNQKSRHLSLIPILLVTIVLFFTVALTDDPFKIWDTVQSANPLWLLLAIASYLVYWLIDAIALHKLVNQLTFPHKKPQYSFSNSIKVAIVGTVFSYLTPSATGGQPVQIHHLRKSGIPLGKATATLIIRFIVFQSSIVMLSLFFYIFYYQAFAQSVNNFRFFIVLGIILNLAAVIFFIFISFLPSLAKKLSPLIINFGKKIKLIKNPSASIERFNNGINDFSSWPKTLSKQPKIIVEQFLLSSIQIIFYALVAFFIFKSISPENIDPLLAITASLSVWMASSFIPLPGGSGGAESSFLLFFSVIYRHSSTAIALLLWRFVAYYLPIIIGSTVLIFDKKSALDNKK